MIKEAAEAKAMVTTALLPEIPEVKHKKEIWNENYRKWINLKSSNGHQSWLTNSKTLENQK